MSIVDFYLKVSKKTKETSEKEKAIAQRLKETNFEKEAIFRKFSNSKKIHFHGFVPLSTCLSKSTELKQLQQIAQNIKAYNQNWNQYTDHTGRRSVLQFYLSNDTESYKIHWLARWCLTGSDKRMLSRYTMEEIPNVLIDLSQKVLDNTKHFIKFKVDTYP